MNTDVKMKENLIKYL